MIENRRREMGVAIYVPFEEQYLTFEALENGTFTLTIASGVTTTVLKDISYSIDNGDTWTTTNNVASTEVTITTPSISAGDKILWKGTGSSMAVSNANSIFSSTCLFNVYGSLLSLFYGDDFKGKTAIGSGGRVDYFAKALFYGSKVVNAKNIFLPTNLGLSVYSNMFYGCVNLISAPVLRADGSFQSCYESMFRNCTSLIKAPDLLASSIGARSYYNMFAGCSSLNYIRCLATTRSTINPTTGWVSGVSATGTFVKDASMNDWPTGTGGIPSGWNIIDE